MDLGDGLHRVVSGSLAVDMTTLMMRLYHEGAKVVVLDGESFVPAKKAEERQISFGCAPSLKLERRSISISRSYVRRSSEADPAADPAVPRQAELRAAERAYARSVAVVTVAPSAAGLTRSRVAAPASPPEPPLVGQPEQQPSPRTAAAS